MAHIPKTIRVSPEAQRLHYGRPRICVMEGAKGSWTSCVGRSGGTEMKIVEVGGAAHGERVGREKENLPFFLSFD